MVSLCEIQQLCIVSVLLDRLARQTSVDFLSLVNLLVETLWKALASGVRVCV